MLRRLRKLKKLERIQIGHEERLAAARRRLRQCEARLGVKAAAFKAAEAALAEQRRRVRRLEDAAIGAAVRVAEFDRPPSPAVDQGTGGEAARRASRPGAVSGDLQSTGTSAGRAPARRFPIHESGLPARPALAGQDAAPLHDDDRDLAADAAGEPAPGRRPRHRVSGVCVTPSPSAPTTGAQLAAARAAAGRGRGGRRSAAAGQAMTTPATQLLEGVEYTSVEVGKSRPFAAACLAVWQERDGRDRRHMLARQSIWVPSELIPLARARLARRAAAAAG